MRTEKIGALTIGQSPRPDLVAPLQRAIPHAEVLECGALDGLEAGNLPDASNAPYPLSTRLKDGSPVLVSDDNISSLLQQKISVLESQGVHAIILMCAGTFAGLSSRVPFIRPYNTGLHTLHTLNMRSIGLIAPFKAQEKPIENRWQKAGFRTFTWTSDINHLRPQDIDYAQSVVQTHQLQCIVLDYFGHPTTAVRSLQEALSIPVLDLGDLAVQTLASILSPNRSIYDHDEN